MIFKLFKRLKTFCVWLLSCGINMLGVGVLGIFIILSQHSWRDNIIKNTILPVLPQFDIPQFSYRNAVISNNQSLIITDIRVLDDTNKTFATIKNITIKPTDFFDIFKGIVEIEFDTITVLRKPEFKDTGNSDNPFAMPPIPFDIQNLHINNIIIKPDVIKNRKEIHLNINAQHILKDNLLAFDIKSASDNEYHITGNIHNNNLTAKVFTHNFNINDVYTIDADIEKLLVNGKVTIQTNIQKSAQIPQINAKMSADMVYKHIPIKADLEGEYLNNNIAMSLRVKQKDNIIINGKITNKNANIILNTQAIDANLQEDIPFIADNVRILTDFNLIKNKIVFKNGHITSPEIVLRNTPHHIPIKITDVTIAFSDNYDTLKIQTARFKTHIAQIIYNTHFSTDFYDYYKPKVASVKMVNVDNPTDTVSLTINHTNNSDNINLNATHLNLNNLFSEQIPIQITDFNTQFTGNLKLFSLDILPTINGTFTNHITHTLSENTTKSTIDIQGIVKNGVTKSDYSLLLNDKPAGAGHITISSDLNTINTTFNTDLQAINVFIQNTPHRITGMVNANIALNNNSLTGDIKINNGTYQNSLYGTVVNNIDIKTKMTDNFIDVTQFTGTTKPTGSITASGIISLSPTIESSLKIKMVDFQPLQNDMVSVNVNSDLALNGYRDSLKLAGGMSLNDLLILLPDVQTSYTPSLNIVVPQKTDNSIPNTTQTVPLLERINTDIAVNITQGAKITGFGVQGFPYGVLQITGTLGTPQMNGQINIARGKIDFFNKNFKITKGGIVIKNNNPLFNIASEYAINTKLINLSLKGTVKNPDIVLSSTPQIPKDEIISLLIFGADKKELSPFQGLQLANTVYQLSRGKSGANSSFDIVGKTERLLNIDELNINSSDNNSVSIGAGKYISEDIYVATEYNPITANNVFRLELKLTDTLDIISRLNTTNKVNNANNSEIMLRKTKDY